jgi:hypothetical protein
MYLCVKHEHIYGTRRSKTLVPVRSQQRWRHLVTHWFLLEILYSDHSFPHNPFLA